MSWLWILFLQRNHANDFENRQRAVKWEKSVSNVQKKMLYFISVIAFGLCNYSEQTRLSSTLVLDPSYFLNNRNPKQTTVERDSFMIARILFVTSRLLIACV